jgi:hypothetical protein
VTPKSAHLRTQRVLPGPQRFRRFRAKRISRWRLGVANECVWSRLGRLTAIHMAMRKRAHLRRPALMAVGECKADTLAT